MRTAFTPAISTHRVQSNRFAGSMLKQCSGLETYFLTKSDGTQIGISVLDDGSLNLMRLKKSKVTDPNRSIAFYQITGPQQTGKTETRQYPIGQGAELSASLLNQLPVGAQWEITFLNADQQPVGSTKSLITKSKPQGGRARYEIREEKRIE